MSLAINWTTVITSGVVATIISCFQVIGNRYLIKALDHLEKSIKPEKRVNETSTDSPNIDY